MDDTTPLDYRRLMIDNSMVDRLVQETNRYVADNLRGKSLTPRSRFHRLVDVTLGEMWSFLGLVIAMGLIVIDDMEEYWSTDNLFSLPFFRSVMKRDRFCLILSFLHTSNNNDQLPRTHPNYDPLFKIRSFVDDITSNFKRVFIPGQNIAIDEAMVAWRGPLSFRVYNPDKPDKFGMKVFELCDSVTGYCCNMEFYTGKQQCSTHGATYDVVDQLMQPYLGCGRTLYVDNYYTSPDLFSYLRDNQTLACGTLRLNRKYGPPKGMLPKLTKRDTTTSALTNGKLTLLLQGREFVILTNHAPLLYLNKAKSDNGRLMRWALLLHQYRFRLESVKGKDNHGPDFLSRS